MSWERSGGDNRADITDMFGSGGGAAGGGTGGGGGGAGGAGGPGQAGSLGGIGGLAGNKRRGVDSDDPALAAGNEKKDLKSEGG